jgi:hypothetical protein
MYKCDAECCSYMQFQAIAIRFLFDNFFLTGFELQFSFLNTFKLSLYKNCEFVKDMDASGLFLFLKNL